MVHQINPTEGSANDFQMENRQLYPSCQSFSHHLVGGLGHEYYKHKSLNDISEHYEIFPIGT